MSMLGQAMFECLPVLIGVSAYVFYRFLLAGPLPIVSQKKVEAKAIEFEEHWEAASEPSSPRSASSESEPDEEPQVEEAADAPRTPSVANWSFFALTVGVIIALSTSDLPDVSQAIASMIVSRPDSKTFCGLDVNPVRLSHAVEHTVIAAGEGMADVRLTTCGEITEQCFKQGDVAFNASSSQEFQTVGHNISEVASTVALTVEHVSDVDFANAERGSGGDGGSALSIRLTRQKVMTDDREDYVRSAYYGTLMVGTPAEPFTVVFDTGSGHLVLPSAYCKSETCRMHKRYRRSASSTGKDINEDGKAVLPGQSRHGISVSFGTGTVTGVFVEDTVCVHTLSDHEEGNSRKGDAVADGDVELPKGCVNLRMIAATQLSEDPFKDFQFDGILGLGLDGLSHTPEFNFLNVVAQSVHAWGGRYPQTFAVFLAESLSEGSEIALGGWSPKHLREDLSWNPVHDPDMGHWIVKIKSIRANGELLNFCSDGQCKGAVDTGTSLISVPSAVFPELYERLKHPTPLSGHCEGHGPLLHIELDSFTVTLGPRDYASAEKTKLGRPKQRLPKIVQPSAERDLRGSPPTVRRDLRCNPGFMTLDMPEPLGPKLFILGEPVLRKYYTAYDAQNKQIGFARARHIKAPSRDNLMVMAANEGIGRRAPNMFDVFRWRKTYR